jgi:hypothetical protein
MAQKRNTASYSNCLALKSALQTRGLYPAMLADATYYDTTQNDIHLAHGQWEDGSYRSVNLRNNSVFFDFIDPNDDALVRAWTVREVYAYIFQILTGINDVTSVPSGNTWTYTIIRNNINYVGTDANEANAACKALTACVNAL